MLKHQNCVLKDSALSNEEEPVSNNCFYFKHDSIKLNPKKGISHVSAVQVLVTMSSKSWYGESFPGKSTQVVYIRRAHHWSSKRVALRKKRRKEEEEERKKEKKLEGKKQKKKKKSKYIERKIRWSSRQQYVHKSILLCKPVVNQDISYALLHD